MASSALQLIGFLIALMGMAATVAAVVMVEWKKESEGKHRVYEGLWMSCSGSVHMWTCVYYHSVLKLPTEVQVTRAVILVSLFFSAVAAPISSVGMKCTHFVDSMPNSKSKIALTGGILFMISGLMTVIVTSWYVNMIVHIVYESHLHQRRDFGNAVFVSWAGGLLTLIGGILLSSMRCFGTRSSDSLSSTELLPARKPKSNYV